MVPQNNLRRGGPDDAGYHAVQRSGPEPIAIVGMGKFDTGQVVLTTNFRSKVVVCLEEFQIHRNSGIFFARKERDGKSSSRTASISMATTTQMQIAPPVFRHAEQTSCARTLGYSIKNSLA